MCLETSRGALVEVLRAYDFIDLYPINPISSSRFRESMYPSLSKDDPMDAALILEILSKHGDRLRKMAAADPKMRMLDGLVQARRRNVDTRVQLINKLTIVYPSLLGIGLIDNNLGDFLKSRT